MSVPGALPAVLVTGKLTGPIVYISTAARERRIVVTIAQRIENKATFLPLLSFINEAVPEANVMNNTGTAMKTLRFIRYVETAERISAVWGNVPNSIAEDSPIRSAAIYVIHVFIDKRIQHLLPVVNVGR